jgi:hypothetical protein
MYDLPPDLPRLRTLETWLLMTLERVRQQISAAEQVEAMDAARRVPPPPPAWALEVDRTRQPAAVHVGDCTMGGERGRPLTRDAALRAIAVEGVAACPFCRPDAALGVLD